MVWRRDDDQHRQRVIWEKVSYPARWHYDCLIEECCRRELWDGVMTLKRAHRVSDVDDPDACLAELGMVGLVEAFDGGDGTWLIRVAEVERHIPDEAVRQKRKRDQDAKRQREHRKRRCQAGEHSKDCPPVSCPVKAAAKSALESPSLTEPVPVPVPVPVPGRHRDASVTHAQDERDAADGWAS
jgi:hypothetical protein